MPEISPLDYAFLALESVENPKHVGPIQILRAPEGASSDYVSRFVTNLRQRQPQPPFNYKLKMTVPNLFGKVPNLLGILPNLPTADFAMPQWRIVESVDMEEHVFHHVLPEPGTKGQLTRKLQELHQPLLNRKRPLWEIGILTKTSKNGCSTFRRGERLCLFPLGTCLCIGEGLCSPEQGQDHRGKRGKGGAV